MTDETKRTRTPREVLDAIERVDADDEADRILALSDEQLDRELSQAGFDADKVRARGRELAAAAVQGEHEGPPANSSGAREVNAVRERAHRGCETQQWRACLDDLDRARVLDPLGVDERIARDRRDASGALGR